MLDFVQGKLVPLKFMGSRKARYRSSKLSFTCLFAGSTSRSEIMACVCILVGRFFCFTRVLVVSDQFSLKIHWKLFVSESWCVNFELMGNGERINCRVQHLKTEVQPVFFSSNFVSERLIRLKANLTLRTSTLSLHGLNWIASILELITKIKVTSSRVPSLFS